jgi:hypothetical protein
MSKNLELVARYEKVIDGMQGVGVWVKEDFNGNFSIRIDKRILIVPGIPEKAIAEKMATEINMAMTAARMVAADRAREITNEFQCNLFDAEKPAEPAKTLSLEDRE